MDEKVKLRIVGAITLVSLSIIFVPMVLDFRSERKLADTHDLSIPARPSTEFASVTVPIEKWSEKNLDDVLAENPVESTGESQATEQAAEQAAQTPSAPAAEPKSVPKDQADEPESRVAPAAPVAALGSDIADEPEDSASAEDAAATPDAQPGSLKAQVEAEQAWVVQVASFTRMENAITLRDKLRTSGFEAFIDSRKKSSGKEIQRVRIGPHATKERAEAVRERVAKSFKLEAMIYQFR